MKTLISLFIAGVSCMSMAAEQVATNQEQATVEQYTYGTHLDIAYLKDVLTRLPTQKTSALTELLPHNWVPASKA